jgi:hypothetical protein
VKIEVTSISTVTAEASELPSTRSMVPLNVLKPPSCLFVILRPVQATLEAAASMASVSLAAARVPGSAALAAAWAMRRRAHGEGEGKREGEVFFYLSP